MQKKCMIKNFLIWIPVGIVVFFVEVFFISVDSQHEFVAEPVLMLGLTAALYCVVSRCKEDSRFAFTKLVVCMLVGRLIPCVIFSYYFDGEGNASMQYMTVIAVFMTVLLLCMGILQMVYDRIVSKKIYSGYALLGTVLAVNAAYTAENIDQISWKPDLYSLEHGIALLLAVAVVVGQYQKNFKQIKENRITGKTYLCNAIKMTFVSFLLFVFPLYELFLSF